MNADDFAIMMILSWFGIKSFMLACGWFIDKWNFNKCNRDSEIIGDLYERIDVLNKRTDELHEQMQSHLQKHE